MPRVAQPTAPASKPSGVDRTEPLAPLPNSLVGDGDAPLRQQILHIPEAEPEAGSVSFCVQNRLRAKSGHGKRLIDEIDLLTKEQSHDHPNQA